MTRLKVVHSSPKTTIIEPVNLSLKAFSKIQKISSAAFLMHILAYRRKARTESEDLFTNELFDLIVDMGFDPFVDGYGNVVCSIGNKYTTLFSCHTDTIDPLQAKEGLHRKPLKVTQIGQHMTITSGIKSQLGADDGVGIWLMLGMMDKDIEGLYVFHREEEIGAGGSTHAVEEFKACGVFQYITKAVAFDRKGTGSVISHQGLGRTASDKFCQALANALNKDIALDYKIDNTGVFTDTANYADDVPECTNISAGYYDEHTFLESLNLNHALDLMRSVLVVDWEALPVDREAGDYDYDTNYGGYAWNYGNGKYSTGYGSYIDYGEGYNQVSTTKVKSNKSSYRDLFDYVVDRPEVVAEYLEFMGITVNDLALFDGDQSNVF